MYFTVAGPRLKSADMPLESLIIRLAAMAAIFGPFGLAVGTGVGLLLEGIKRQVFPPLRVPQDRSIGDLSAPSAKQPQATDR